MNKKFLRRFTKHILLATKRHEKKEKKPLLLERNPPKIPQTPKMRPSLEVLAKTLTKVPAKPLVTFGKLDILLNDPAMQILECPGPGKRINIKKYGNVEQTDITLTQDEISDIIDKFSKQTNLPLTQVFKAKIQNLEITAFISPVVGSKFMIVKE